MNCYHCGTPMIGEGIVLHCPKCAVPSFATTTMTPPWTIEDARMLREQIRVADRAYQRLHEEHAQLKKRVGHLLEYARHMPTCPMPAKECDCGLKELMEGLE